MKRNFKIGFISIILIGVVVACVVIANLMINPKEDEVLPLGTQTEAETTTLENIIITENGIDYEYRTTTGYTAMVALNNKNIVSKEPFNKLISVAQKSVNRRNEYSGYDLKVYAIPVLYQDEHLVGIEYLLENCVGNINGTLLYDIGPQFQVKSVPYTIKSNQQDDVYMGLYVKFSQLNPTNSEILEVLGEVMYKARLRVKLTYDNGEESVEYFGFRQYSKFNVNNYAIFKLTLQ